MVAIFIMNEHEKEIQILLDAIKVRDDAIEDLIDGDSPEGIHWHTGLPIERCVELYNMKRYEHVK